jgi:hypothetical protein
MKTLGALLVLSSAILFSQMHSKNPAKAKPGNSGSDQASAQTQLTVRKVNSAQDNTPSKTGNAGLASKGSVNLAHLSGAGGSGKKDDSTKTDKLALANSPAGKILERKSLTISPEPTSSLLFLTGGLPFVARFLRKSRA